jgi:hypothetical protein
MSWFARRACFSVLLGLAGAMLAVVPAGSAKLVDHLAPSAGMAAPPGPVAATNYEAVELVANQIHMMITNVGNFGNNFQNSSPSLEYPPGLGFEHLTHAGLWVGGQSADSLGAYIGVATGGYDQTLALAPDELSEFSPIASIWPRSDIPSSPYYDPAAVSDMDLISTRCCS